MKILTSFAALAMVARLAGAQANVAPSPRYGIVGGLNLASLSDEPGLGNRTAFNGGVMLSLPVSNGFAIQPELLYTMKGASEASNGVSGAAKINYLELPVLMRYDIPVSGGVRPLVYAGPSVALKTGCSIEATDGTAHVSFSCEDAVREVGDPGTSLTFANADVGGVVGGGLAFDVGARQLTIGVRYELGFVSISSNSDSKNRVLSFVGTFEWPFHR